jgi:hypothetical protein
MLVYTTQKFILLLIASVLIGLVAVAASVPAVNYYSHSPPPNISALKTQTFWYFAEDSNPLFNQTVTRLETYGIPAIRLDSSQITTTQTLRMTSTPDSFILFPGDWIAARVNDNQTQTFLSRVLNKEAKVVAIGGQTGALFDALKKGGLIANVTPEPYAPATGFRLKVGTTPNGGTYLYPSNLYQNTSDPNALIQGWNDWLTGP